MTQEEVFRLKPGDLLRVETETESEPRYVQAYYAIVVAGAGPDVTLAWHLRRLPGPLTASGRWHTMDPTAIFSVLHRSRLTRIA
jgi:hypothetical protein